MSKVIPICPKCGYDQSGAIATWESQCPMEGRCPECGLVFAWGGVMDPSRTAMAWYVEHGHSKWELISRTPGTMRRLALPWVFWRAVGVEAEIRLKPLIAWVVLFVVGLHLVVSIPVGFGLWHVASGRYYGSLENLYQSAGLKGLLVPVINGLGSPFVNAGVSYRSGDLVLLSGLYSGGEMRDAFLITSPFIGMTLLWMVVMLGLQATRRRAKIRSAHILRAGLISLLTIFLAFELARGAGALDLWTGSLWFKARFWLRALTESIIPVMMIWVLVFWASAIRAGWKVRPSGFLISLGTIASLLGGFVFYFVVAVYFDWI